MTHKPTREDVMKKTILFAALAVMLAGTLVIAQTTPKLPKTYQVTGPVLELTDDVITVQKDKDKWELARTKDTKITGELKVGAKVTITYRMMAAGIEVRPEAKKK
jgi:hypothetical protein